MSQTEILAKQLKRCLKVIEAQSEYLAACQLGRVAPNHVLVTVANAGLIVRAAEQALQEYDL